MLQLLIYKIIYKNIMWLFKLFYDMLVDSGGGYFIFGV